MAEALIITGIILMYYCAKEMRYPKPSLARAVNSALFWPFSIFFNTYKRSKE
ncbi:hypothetical protein [Dyadobacter sp. NIV53]|uniref:hypothetical protein n=1 Tax=Dyadobacter sp. NIV53 TaxID=2861765 RepID=UPI001C8703D5|nr:hypothetical protein [Dyadobacter sp. NIV53]